MGGLLDYVGEMDILSINEMFALALGVMEDARPLLENSQTGCSQISNGQEYKIPTHLLDFL